METAQLLLEGAGQTLGSMPKVRPLEALGVFYALDCYFSVRKGHESDKRARGLFEPLVSG